MASWYSTIDQLFVQPEQFVWLWLVAGAACAVTFGELLRLRWRRRLIRLSGGQPARRSQNVGRWLAVAVRVLTLALIAVALADPRAGLGAVQVKQSKLQLVFAVDRSRSMHAEDVQGSRLEAAKRLVADAIEEAGGAAVALATFAGDARIDVPLTRDYRGFLDRLGPIRPEANAVAGSNLGLGIETAISCFADRIEGPKVLVVITDGETHGIEPNVAGVRVPEGMRALVLGVGDAEQGARIPLDAKDGDGTEDQRYLTYDGDVVWSKADPQRLRQLASRLGGTFAMIGTGPASSLIRETLQEVESAGSAAASRAFRRQFQPRFHWLLLGALSLLALEMVVPGKAGRVTLAATGQPMAPGLVLCVLSLGAAANTSAAEPPQQAADSPPTVRRLSQLYNEGVRSYRAARWRQADVSFRTVARHAEGALQSKALFNRASVQYQLVDEGGISRDQAIQQLQNGIAMLRRCIARGHRVEDARANIEILYRRLRQIEQQPPSGQGEGDTSQQEDPQDDGDRPEEEPDEDEGDSRPPPSSPEGDDRGRPPDRGDDRGNGEQSDASNDGERPSPNRPPPPGDGDANGQSDAPGSGGGEAAEDRRRPLTDEEAEQQLRRIRQRSRQQREQEEQQGAEAVPVSPPVGLPW